LELLDLKATFRTTRGNGPARVLRRENKIPAVLYGPGRESVPLSVDVTALEKAIKKSKGQVMVNMIVEGEGQGTYAAMLKELQTHPVSRDFIHADFYEIAMDRKIRVMVPVTTVGKAIGVEMGGMLQIIRRELEVLCFPNEIPESIEIDITDLDNGDSVHIEDVKPEGDIEFPHEVNFTILTVLAAKAQEEEEEEGEEEGEGEEGEGEETSEDGDE